MASGTIPAFYKFKEIGRRKFCDGGWLSNTPFRELLQAHRDYWVNAAGNDDTHKIPDLDVYIVNVNPSNVDNVPSDYDEVNNRQTEITFLDRNSHYDEMVAHLVTDYNELEKTLIDSIGLLVELKAFNNHIGNKSEGASFQNKLESILLITEGKSKDLKHTRKKYKDLIKGKFRLNSVLRIERSNEVDPSTGREVDYSSKPNDFTQDTIRKLIKQGERDALKILKGC
jgi:NTE family protein